MIYNYKAIIFDMDGVLVDVKSSWAQVHKSFCVDNEDSLKAYKKGIIGDEEFIRRDIALWKAESPQISKKDITKILKKVPLMKGFSDTIPYLCERYTTGVISGGLKPLAEFIGGDHFDFILANDLEEKNGELTGEGIVEVKLDGKGVVFEKLTSRLSIEKERCIAVGNSHFDVPMIERAGLGIAFNPDDKEIMNAADLVIEEKDLSLLIDRLGL